MCFFCGNLENTPREADMASFFIAISPLLILMIRRLYVEF